MGTFHALNLTPHYYSATEITKLFKQYQRIRYQENRLKINNDKSKVMLVGSKAQLKPLNVCVFISNYEVTPLELVENAKYLDMSIDSDISWDFQVQRPCQNMYYHLSLFRQLRRIFPQDLLLQAYKSYIQPLLDYGITLYGCSKQKNIDLVQKVQNHAARLITGNFDYMNGHAIELVKSLNLYTIRDRRDHFLTILMLKSIHGIAPTRLLDRILMLMAMTPEDRIWNYTSTRRVKRLIEIISCIWVANCGAISWVCTKFCKHWIIQT